MRTLISILLLQFLFSCLKFKLFCAMNLCFKQNPKFLRTANAPRKRRTANTAHMDEDNSAANGIKAVKMAVKPREVPTTTRGPSN